VVRVVVVVTVFLLAVLVTHQVLHLHKEIMVVTVQVESFKVVVVVAVHQQ
jgi:hypothetical protein